MSNEAGCNIHSAEVALLGVLNTHTYIEISVMHTNRRTVRVMDSKAQLRGITDVSSLLDSNRQVAISIAQPQG